MQHCSSRAGLRNLIGRCRISQAAVASLLFLASFAAAQAHSSIDERGESPPPQLHGETSLPVRVARMDGLRALWSFLRLRAKFEEASRACWEKRDRSNAEPARLIADEFTSLIDLSEVPVASRRAIGAETRGCLLDLFGCVPLPQGRSQRLALAEVLGDGRRFRFLVVSNDISRECLAPGGRPLVLRRRRHS